MQVALRVQTDRCVCNWYGPSSRHCHRKFYIRNGRKTQLICDYALFTIPFHSIRKWQSYNCILHLLTFTNEFSFIQLRLLFVRCTMFHYVIIVSCFIRIKLSQAKEREREWEQEWSSGVHSQLIENRNESRMRFKQCILYMFSKPNQIGRYEHIQSTYEHTHTYISFLLEQHDTLHVK